MNRINNLYLIIGVLLVVAIGLGIRLYHEQRKPDGVEINIGEGGVSIEKK